MSDKRYKKENKQKKNKDYKEKGKKSCCIAEEEHAELDTKYENEGEEVVYVAVKEDP